MSKMKTFLSDVSIRMGYEGEINSSVLHAAQMLMNDNDIEKCPICGHFVGQHSPDCKVMKEENDGES
jgi:hypothetical protein